MHARMYSAIPHACAHACAEMALKGTFTTTEIECEIIRNFEKKTYRMLGYENKIYFLLQKKDL